jgi:predicted nucleic acid-binding protein
MLIYYFSFFNEKSARRQLIKKLPKRGCKLIIPDFAMEELMGDKERIKEFARINELEFMFLFSLLEREIEVYSQEEYEEFLSEARNISPYSMIVHKDGPYFALALSHHTPIWSNKKAFKEQSRVKVFSTSDLISFLSQA